MKQDHINTLDRRHSTSLNFFHLLVNETLLKLDFLSEFCLMWNHSYKKLKNGLEKTRAVKIEISLMSWNLPNGSKHRRSILKKMPGSNGISYLQELFIPDAIMEKMEADILQIAKKWNWKWIFAQGYFFRKIPAISASFAPKYVHLQGWSPKFGQNCKDVPTKILKWNVGVGRLKVISRIHVAIVLLETIYHKSKETAKTKTKKNNYCIFHGLPGKIWGNDQIWVKKLKNLIFLVIWACYIPF